MATTKESKILIVMLLKLLIEKLINFFKKPSNTEKIYQKAKQMLGQDASPLDFVSDELGCAESVSNIISKIIKFPIMTGTYSLNYYLKHNNNFVSFEIPKKRGTIIISPTGTGNGKIRGHVGILGEYGIIMAANSANGIWSENYNLESWRKRYQDKGGFPIYFYELK